MRGQPIRQKIDKSASQGSFAIKVFNGMASGQRVQLSTKHKTYSWPLELFGTIGPIKSTFTWSNAMVARGTATIGTRSNLVLHTDF